MAQGVISYAEGGWRAPWGIELRIDLLNALVLLVVTGICAIVLTASPRSLDQEIWPENHSKFYALYLLCMTGLAGMTITGDAFNIFVFLEISSLSSYALISQGTTRRALTSSIQYLVMGTIGGTFILLGIGMIYMVTGTLNIADMAVQLAAVGPNRTVLVALACIGIGTAHQAGGVSAPHLAAQRLHLCAGHRDRVSRRHRHQGRVLRAGALRVLGVRRSARFRVCSASMRCSCRWPLPRCSQARLWPSFRTT